MAGRVMRDFPAHYEIEYLEQAPSGVSLHRYSANDPAALPTSVLKVEMPDAHSWVGEFSNWGPDRGVGLCSAVSTTPSPDVVCVVEQGEAWLIDVREPDHGKRVRVAGGYVATVVPLPGLGLLLLVSPLAITAVGRSGSPKWTTVQLAGDEVEVTGTRGGRIVGIADREIGASRPFEVDPHTGKASGGAIRFFRRDPFR